MDCMRRLALLRRKLRSGLWNFTGRAYTRRNHGVEKSGSRVPAPEGSFKNGPLMICLKAYPDTNLAILNPGRRYMKNSAAKMYYPLYEADPQIAAAIDNETRPQHEGLELIASENFVSEAVLEAAGSVFTNKYREGYPGRRYYGASGSPDRGDNQCTGRA